MFLIMNERKYAEYILNTGDFGTSVSTSLFVLAKYYGQVKGMKKKAIMDSLDEIMAAVYPGYIKENWVTMLEKAAKQATKYPLIEIDSIPVTQKELDAISQLNYQDEKKLAFALLVIAKFFNVTRTNNNNWVNCEPKTIFKYANVNESQVNQAKMYSVLTKAGIIMYSRKTGSVNAQVLIVDNDGESVDDVTDLRSLGHEYLRYNGAKYNRCECCGILVKQGIKKPTKFCSYCSGKDGMRFKTIICDDCGKEVVVSKSNSRGCRCKDCQINFYRAHNRAHKAEIKNNSRFKTNLIADIDAM